MLLGLELVAAEVLDVGRLGRGGGLAVTELLYMGRNVLATSCLGGSV